MTTAQGATPPGPARTAPSGVAPKPLPAAAAPLHPPQVTPIRDTPARPPGVAGPKAAPPVMPAPPGPRPVPVAVPPVQLPGARPVPPPAPPARLRPRHRRLAISFGIIVVLPVLATLCYLLLIATPQYASRMAFTVRSEAHSPAASELLGGFGALLGGSASSDSEILKNFILSQEMVSRVDARIDLGKTFRGNGRYDPLFTYDADGSTIEHLTDYWRRMVHVSHESASGILELEILAFSAEDAQKIAEIVHEESTVMINNLSAVAREDALRYAGEDLSRALDQVKIAREAVTDFRIRNQIVDIATDLAGQSGIIATLQQQLATALVELDLLQNSTTASDPRLTQSERRIQAIRDRIAEERQKIGYSDGEESYATIAGEYERLTVEREFAEALYVAALRQQELALAEAKRQTRYLATHIQPSLAQSAEYPRNGFILAGVAFFAFLSWAIMTLVFYAVRDRN